MYYCGIDPHKDNNVLSIINENGVFLKSKSFKNIDSGHDALLKFLREETSELIIGIENPRSYAMNLSQYLVSKGEKVLAVPSQFTGEYRKKGTLKQKNDENDSLAVARAVMQECDNLPEIKISGIQDGISFLMENLDNLKSERNRTINRLHAQLRVLESGYEYDLSNKKTIQELSEKIKAEGVTVKDARLFCTKILCERLVELYDDIKEIEDEIRKYLDEVKTDNLSNIVGVGEYATAKILGIVGDIKLFRSEGAFANYSGLAPISCSSGKNTRYRVNTGGNRKLNSVFHWIMMTQIRVCPKAKEYYERKKSEGKTPKEAQRCLKRHISNAVYRALVKDFSLA